MQRLESVKVEILIPIACVKKSVKIHILSLNHLSKMMGRLYLVSLGPDNYDFKKKGLEICNWCNS